MKTKNNIIRATIIVITAFTAISLLFLPDRVPVHYGINGSADRIGSKYETLVIPALMILSYIITKGKIKATKELENQLLTTLCGTLLVVGAIDIHFVYNMVTHKDTELASMSGISMRVIMVSVAVLIIIVGNIMPKLRRNNFIGLKTSWSQHSDLIWQKTQRFGGITFVIEGLLLIVINVAVKAKIYSLLSLIIILLLIPVELIGSYLIYKKYRTEDE